MDDFQLRTLEEDCFTAIRDSGGRLDVKETGKHYLLSSGLHTGVFFQLSRVFEESSVRERLARLMLIKIKEAGINPRDIDILLGPAMGALPLIYTLQHFFEFSHTRVIFAEKKNKRGREFRLGRGFVLHPDKRVFIIDDVGTTFGTVRKTIETANKACAKLGWDAQITGFAVLIDRTAEDYPSPQKFAPLLKYVCALRSPLESYPIEECPYCKEGIKLVRV